MKFLYFFGWALIYSVISCFIYGLNTKWEMDEGAGPYAFMGLFITVLIYIFTPFWRVF